MCACVCGLERLDEFDEVSNVVIYSCSKILLKMVAVLAFPIPGLILQGDETPSWHTSNLANLRASKLTLDMYGWD